MNLNVVVTSSKMKCVRVTTKDIIVRTRGILMDDCLVKLRKIVEAVGICNILLKKFLMKNLCAQLLAVDTESIRKDISIQCSEMFHCNPKDCLRQSLNVD